MLERMCPRPRYLDLTLPECYVPELGDQKQGKARGVGAGGTSRSYQTWDLVKRM